MNKSINTGISLTPKLTNVSFYIYLGCGDNIRSLLHWIQYHGSKVIEVIKLLVTVLGMSEFKDKGRRAADGTFTGLDTEPIVLS